MSSPLIQKLIDEYQYVLIDEGNIESWLAENSQVVLFFSGDTQQFPESNDVAVVLPELMKIYSERISVAVVSQSSQQLLQSRFGFSSWPSLVFLRDGKYLGVISQIQNWDDYLNDFERILNSSARQLPIFKIPVVNQTHSCQN